MPLPVTMHRIVLRYQDGSDAFELAFTPEQVKVLVVHKRGVSVVPSGQPKSTHGVPGDLGSLDGVASEQPTAPRQPTQGHGVASWRADTGPWHELDLSNFSIVEIEVEYSSMLGGNFLTVLNPDVWDHVILRRVRAPDPNYRVPDGANGWRVRRAQDLLSRNNEDEPYIVHETRAATSNSEAMLVGKHRWDCTWYGLE